MPVSLDDLQGNRYQQLVSSPTPYAPGFPTNYPTPFMTGGQLIDDYRTKMFSSINLGSMQAMGLAQAQAFNINNPFGNPYGAAAGMAPPYMMTPANYNAFRPGPPPVPPAMFSTPGVTGQFTNPADLAVQYQLMRTGMFADPATARNNYGRMRMYQFGQDYGAGFGTALGVGTSLIPGVGAMGGSMIGSLGQMALERLNDVPYLGGALRWGIGALNQNVAESLAWTGGAQHGTLGRVMVGSEEMGLGGRGLNMQASMRLGRQMRTMSLQTGQPWEAGSMNQVDMINLLRTAGDVGFLESATNVDQISKTVGNLMKLVGSLAKITGDPDFRNNLRELGNLRTMGLNMGQGMEALQMMNSYSRMAGMTRGELMQTGGLPGATRAVAAGLTPGVGLLAGAYGQGQARLLRGTFTETQQALFGDIGQIITEGQIGFAAGVAPNIIPALLSAQGGEVGLDKKKIEELMRGGPLDITQIAGRGAQNLNTIATQVAQNRAKAEGRAVRGSEVPDIMLETMVKMQEYQSDLANILKPEGMEQLRFQLYKGTQTYQNMGDMQAAMLVSGGNAKEAQILAQSWRDPRVRRRREAMEEQERERQRMTDVSEARSRQEEMDDIAAQSRNSVYGAWTSFKKWWKEPMTMTESDYRKSEDQLRRMQREGAEATGSGAVPLAGPLSYAGEDVMKLMRDAVQAGSWNAGSVNNIRSFRTGREQLLTEEEAKLGARWTGENLDDWRSLVGTKNLRDALGGRKALSLGDDRFMSETEARSRIERVRSLRSESKETYETLQKASKLGDSSFQSANANILEAVSKEQGMKPSADVLYSILSSVRNEASARGRVGKPVSIAELREKVISSLNQSGLSWNRARNTVEGQTEFFNSYIAQAIETSGDKDAQRALKEGADTFLTAGPLNLGKAEGTLKQAEQDAAQGLGEAGILPKNEGWFGLEGLLSDKYSFSTEGREAFQTFFKGARDLGDDLKEGDEGRRKAAMISLLVAREQVGSKEQKEQAGKILASLEGKKEMPLVRKIRENLSATTTEQRKILSNMGEKFLAGYQGSAEGALSSMTKAEVDTIKTGQGEAVPIYKTLEKRAMYENIFGNNPKKEEPTEATDGKGDVSKLYGAIERQGQGTIAAIKEQTAVLRAGLSKNQFPISEAN